MRRAALLTLSVLISDVPMLWRRAARLKSGMHARAMHRGFAANIWMPATMPSSNVSQQHRAQLSRACSKVFQSRGM